MKPKNNFNTAKSLPEWFPDQTTFWVVFDMTNGDKGSRRYLWWFDTKKQALNHIKQFNKPHNAPLSTPHKVELLTGG